MSKIISIREIAATVQIDGAVQGRWRDAQIEQLPRLANYFAQKSRTPKRKPRMSVFDIER